MAINATKSNNEFEYELVPAGNHIARVVQIIQIGTVMESYQGGPESPKQKVRLVWELPTKLRDWHDKDGKVVGKVPHIIGADYTLSINPKSGMYKILLAFYDRAEIEKAGNAFDITPLIGKACLLNVSHTEGKEGKVWPKVETATPIPDGIEAPALAGEMFVFEYETGTLQDVETKLPKFVVDRMRTTPEFQKKFGAQKTPEYPTEDSEKMVKEIKF